MNGGAVISALVGKYNASAFKHSFIQHKVPLFVVILALCVILLLLIWNGWEKYSEYRATQLQQMQKSSWAAANEVSNYVKQTQSSVKMFVENESKHIQALKLEDSIESSSFYILKEKIKVHYPDAINFLLWDTNGKLIIDSDGTQIDKPEIFKLPSIGNVLDEYVVRMHHNSGYNHFNIIVPWKSNSLLLGIFGLSFPSELIQPLLTNHQSIDHQLVLWRNDSPGFVEFLGPDSELILLHDLYLEEEDMRRVGSVANVSGTDWDVVSLHRPDLFASKLMQIIINGLYKFLIVLATVLLAYYLYNKELKRRFKATEKVRRNEERLQLALESTQDGIWEVDYKSGQYFFNDRWYQILGYANNELKNEGIKWDALIHKDDVDDAKRIYDLHLAGEIDNYDHEHRVKHKSGEWIWVHDRGRILEWNEDGAPLRAIGTTADITVRKRAETSLRNNEEALHSFYSIISASEAPLHVLIQKILAAGCQYLGMKCGIFSYIEGDRYTIMQLHTTSSEYKIQSGDKFDLGITYCQFTLEQKKPVGFAHASATEVSSHPAYEALKLEAYIGAPIFLDSNPYGTLNFTSINFREEEFTDSEKYYVQLMAEWISNKLQSQISKQRQEEVSQTLKLHLENSPTATIEWGAQGKIKRWSKKAEDIFGWQSKEVLGKSPSNWPIQHPSQKNAIKVLHDLMNDDGQETLQFNFELPLNDGVICYTEWAATRTKDLFNRDISYLAIIQDVSERVNAQRELLRSQARFHDLYQNAPDMYLTIDTSGKIQSANNICAENLGYNKDELLNKPYWNFIHKNDVRRVRRHINVVFNDQVNECELEARVLNKNGDSINTHQRLRLVEAHEGMPRELRILCRDITQRATSQQERLEHIKVQRDELGREMRHRIKNNLQAIVGLLKVNLDTYPELENVLVTSINQVDTIAIVNNLMLDSEHSLVNLVDLVNRITQASMKLFSQEVCFKVLCEDEEYIELWEEETVTVSLIISEIITNAMKHRDDSDAATNSNGVQIIIDDDPSGLVIDVANLVDGTMGAFDVNEKSQQGGVGLGMVQSLMPPEGAKLEYYQQDHYLHAKLILNPPVILNSNLSEVEVLEAVF